MYIIFYKRLLPDEKKCITFAPSFGAEPSVMEVTLNREPGVNPGLYPQL